VLPQLRELRLVECDTAHLDAFFSRLEHARKIIELPDGTTAEKPQLAANTRRMVRAIVGGIMQQAVLHQTVATNPVRNLERIESPKGHKKAPPHGLTAEERRRLLANVDTDKAAIRADMPDLIRFALGSGLRVGEICAVRWMDLDLDGIPVVSETDMRLVPVVAVRQNVYPVKGKGVPMAGVPEVCRKRRSALCVPEYSFRGRWSALQHAKRTPARTAAAVPEKS
jgi:integrase